MGSFSESDEHSASFEEARTARMPQVTDDAHLNGNSRTAEFIVKYRGKNYEISDFLKKHPGGRDNLSQFRGSNLDKVFTQVPHSEAAFHLFEEFVLDKQEEYAHIENLVDWKKPLLGQVGKLGDRYWEWVNLPVNRPIRLFESNFLENLSITPWYLVPMVWIPILLFFVYLGCANNSSNNVQTTIPMIVASVTSGIFLWTLMEYVFHRNLFHLRPPSNSRTLIVLHFILHGVHHKSPFDDQRLVFPPVPAVLAACIFYKVYEAVLPSTVLFFVASGTMAGYLCYDLMHYYLHHGTPGVDSYLYVMKRYHNHHHFSHHEEGFGISSRIWDFVFGTTIPLKKLKKAIVW